MKKHLTDNNLHNLRKIREEKKLTRDELANLSGVNKFTIQALENGLTSTSNAKLSTLTALAKALNVKVRDIVNESVKIYL